MTVAQPAIGHNQGPPLSPFEAAKEKIESLYEEARLWLDGEPITTQGQADDLSNLLNMIRAAHAEADEARKEENKPFDEGKAEVQARYAELIADTKAKKGKTILAMEACKKALAPWLEKLAAERKAIARKAREEADAQQRAAQEAVRAAQAATDLAAREAAEQQLQEAKQANAAAKRAEKDTAKAGNGVGRAVSLRTNYRPVLIDPMAAGAHYWGTHHRAEIEQLFVTLAERDVRAGKRAIPGFEIIEEKTAV